MFPELLRQSLAGIVELSDSQVAILEAHYELLVRWNRKVNLTRIEKLEDAVERHYAESLFLAAHLPPGELRIVDIGSGPGFPGFPIAVLRADCAVVLIESHQRKAVFLREAGRGLPNVQVKASRAEDIREAFDIAVSRAVSYSDLGKVLWSLAPEAYLLTGSEEPDEIGFVPSKVLALPWGSQRFLRIGHKG